MLRYETKKALPRRKCDGYATNLHFGVATFEQSNGEMNALLENVYRRFADEQFDDEIARTLLVQFVLDRTQLFGRLLL